MHDSYVARSIRPRRRFRGIGQIVMPRRLNWLTSGDATLTGPVNCRKRLCRPAPHERGADRPRNHEQACVSSDLEEVIGLSHRVMVLARGRLQGTLKHGDATNVAIMELATR